MAELKYDKTGRLLFTKEMKKDYTILIPNMLPIHFELIRNVLLNYGYHLELLQTVNPNIQKEGLQNVHNDTCYPALLVIGQFLDALKSGKYDLDKTALIITQTGGGCRASNYIHLLRKALHKSGFDKIPVISLNLSGLEKNPGFKLTLKMIRQMIASLAYGDLLMLLHNQVRPYELVEGESQRMVDKWIATLAGMFAKNAGFAQGEIIANFDDIIADFATIQVRPRDKIRVGIVGEIFVKYSPLGNNKLEEFLLSEGTEPVVPGVMDFMMFKVDNRMEDIKIYGGNKIKYVVCDILKKYFLKTQRCMIASLQKNGRFDAPNDFEHLKSLVKGVIGYGNKMGEGWLLTAEMMELVESGVENVVCTQPFGCLPNHIAGKGMIRKIKEVLPQANIVAIDYDPGATKVNQENRIKLMLATAQSRREAERDSQSQPAHTSASQANGKTPEAVNG